MGLKKIMRLKRIMGLNGKYQTYSHASPIALSLVKEAELVEPARVGHGHAFGHHGEIVQGAMRYDERIIQRFLVTLPCRKLMSRVKFEPLAGLAGKIYTPSKKPKSLRAGEIALRHLQRSDYGGRLTFESNIEEGFGLGSSTADVIATIRAVGDAFRVYLSPQTVSKMAVEAERASDSTMFDDSCVVFAQRRGVVLEYLGNGLPPLHVLSVNTQKDAPVDTVATPAARYCDLELQGFRALRGMIRRAIRTNDPHLLGRVATASATISQRHLPKSAFGEIKAISKAHGACGIQVSHSGTVVGILFSARCPELNAKLNATKKDLLSIAMKSDFSFSTSQKGISQHVS